MVRGRGENLQRGRRAISAVLHGLNDVSSRFFFLCRDAKRRLSGKECRISVSGSVAREIRRCHWIGLSPGIVYDRSFRFFDLFFSCFLFCFSFGFRITV